MKKSKTGPSQLSDFLSSHVIASVCSPLWCSRWLWCPQQRLPKLPVKWTYLQSIHPWVFCCNNKKGTHTFINCKHTQDSCRFQRWKQPKKEAPCQGQGAAWSTGTVDGPASTQPREGLGGNSNASQMVEGRKAQRCKRICSWTDGSGSLWQSWGRSSGGTWGSWFLVVSLPHCDKGIASLKDNWSVSIHQWISCTANFILPTWFPLSLSSSSFIVFLLLSFSSPFSSSSFSSSSFSPSTRNWTQSLHTKLHLQSLFYLFILRQDLTTLLNCPGWA